MGSITSPLLRADHVLHPQTWPVYNRLAPATSTGVRGCVEQGQLSSEVKVRGKSLLGCASAQYVRVSGK